MQKTQQWSCTSCWKFWWLDDRWSQSFHSEGCESRNNRRYAIVVQDLATQWIQAYSCKQKLHKKPSEACKSSWSPTGNLKSFTLTIPWNSANHVKISPGIIARLHHTDQKHMGLLKEHCRVKEGTSAILLQSGLNESRLADSMGYYFYLRNVTDLLSDGQTPYERRFGQLFQGPIIPFGSLVEYHRTTAEDQSRIRQFGKKVLTWIVPRIRSVRGGTLEGVTYWSQPWGVGDDGRIGNLLEKTQCERGDISHRKRRIYFSNRRWTNQTRWRRSRPEKHPPWYGSDQFEEKVTLIFLENQKGLFHHHLTTRFRMPVKRLMIFGPCQETSYTRHHVESRVKLYSPREESFLIPLKYIDVARTTHTNLDVKQEKRIDDYWNIDGSQNSSDPWTGFTQFTPLEVKTSRRIYVVRGEINEKTADIQARSSMVRNLENNGKKRQAEGKAKVVEASISLTVRTRSSRETIKECSQVIGNTNGSCYALQNYEDELWE